MRTSEKFLVWAWWLTFQLAFLPSSAQEKSSQTLLTIEGNPIMLDEFLYLYNKNYQDHPQAYSEESVREYLDLFINFKLKIAEAIQLGYNTDPAFLQEFESYRDQLVQPYLNSQEMKDAMLREAYERLQQEIHVSHILLRISPYAPPEDTLAVYQQITAIREEILDGADFGDMAAKYSEDPSAKQNGGDLGYFTGLQMVYDFESMAYRTPVGEVSLPIRTRFGYHIIKVHDKRPARGSVKVAHIMIRATEGIPAQDSIAAREKIFEIAHQLENGGDWEELCRQFSEDLATREQGGELKWFSTGAMMSSFADAAFSLEQPGELSPPIKTPYGWHIIKLIDKKALGSFTDMQAELREKLSRDSRSETMRQQFIEELKSSYHFQENALVKKQLFERLMDQNNAKSESVSLNDISSSLLFTLGDSVYRAEKFIDFLNKSKIPVADSLATVFLNAQYEQFVDGQVLAYEEANLPNKHPAFRHLVREYREGLLLFRIMEEEIWNKAVTDTLGLKGFFEGHRSQYQWEERVEALVINADKEENAQKALAAYEKGYFPVPNFAVKQLVFEPRTNDWNDSILTIIDRTVFKLKTDKSLYLKVRAYYIKPEKKSIVPQRLEKLKAYLESRNIQKEQLLPMENMGKQKIKGQGGGIYLEIMSQKIDHLEKQFNQENPLAVKIQKKTFEKGDNAHVDAVPWEVGTHLLQEDNRTVLVHIFEVLPSKLKALDECRGQVISDYQTFLEEKWVDSLKNQYEVEVHEETLESIIQE